MVIQALPQNGPKGLLMANNDILDMFYNLNERLLTSVLSTLGNPQYGQGMLDHFACGIRSTCPKGATMDLLMANNDILDMFYNLNERLLTSVVYPPGQQPLYEQGMLDHFAHGHPSTSPKWT
jgi:hypothetical protein